MKVVQIHEYSLELQRSRSFVLNPLVDLVLLILKCGWVAKLKEIKTTRFTFLLDIYQQLQF